MSILFDFDEKKYMKMMEEKGIQKGIQQERERSEKLLAEKDAIIESLKRKLEAL